MDEKTKLLLSALKAIAGWFPLEDEATRMGVNTLQSTDQIMSDLAQNTLDDYYLGPIDKNGSDRQ